MQQGEWGRGKKKEKGKGKGKGKEKGNEQGKGKGKGKGRERWKEESLRKVGCTDSHSGDFILCPVLCIPLDRQILLLGKVIGC